MEELDLFGADYYFSGLLVVFGGIIALYTAIHILWNMKWVPARRAKGVATPNFGNFFNRIITFAFKEDPRTVAPKKITNSKIQKLLSLKTINVLLLVTTFAMIMLGIIEAYIPALILISIIWIQTAKPLTERDSIVNRMFIVANKSFGYGRGAELNPWGYIRVKSWENLTQPKEIHVTLPAAYNASNLGSRDGFEAHFNSTVTDNNAWIYEWKNADGLVIVRPISHLTTLSTYPGSDKHPWHVIPIGEGVNGEVTVDLTGTPHMLVCGSTGSGKSVLQRNLIFHCIQHNDMWRFMGVDVKRVELSPFKKYNKTILGIGTNLEDGVEIVRYCRDVMNERYEEMEQRGVNHFKDLLDENGKPPYAIMLMVDEAFMFLSPEGAKTEEGKQRDELHAEAGSVLGDIARLGRASGIHLVLATQRPDATVIKGELKANLDIRIAAGRLDATPSSMVLDSGAATQLPGHIKGRGIVRFGGNQEQFQGYFAGAEWIDEWLLENPGVEPDFDSEMRAKGIVSKKQQAILDAQAEEETNVDLDSEENFGETSEPYSINEKRDLDLDVLPDFEDGKIESLEELESKLFESTQDELASPVELPNLEEETVPAVEEDYDLSKVVPATWDKPVKQEEKKIDLSGLEDMTDEEAAEKLKELENSLGIYNDSDYVAVDKPVATPVMPSKPVLPTMGTVATEALNNASQGSLPVPQSLPKLPELPKLPQLPGLPPKE